MADNFSHPTLDKIGSLREKLGDNPAYESDVQQVNDWEKEVRDLVARETLAEDPKMRDILAEYRENLNRIDGRLLTEDSTKLPDGQRDRLLDEKKFYEGFLARFDVKQIRAEIEAVDKEVQENIKSI